MEGPKFTIGQKVKFQNDDDREYGEVLSFSYDPQNGWTYKISGRELDHIAKDIVQGIKICREDELVDMTEFAKTNEAKPAEPTANTKVVNLSDNVKEEQPK